MIRQPLQVESSSPRTGTSFVVTSNNGEIVIFTVTSSPPRLAGRQPHGHTIRLKTLKRQTKLLSLKRIKR